MDYANDLTCDRVKCGWPLTVPIKLIRFINKITDIARCPICHETFKFRLPLKEKDQWLPFIRPKFFCCDECGMSNSDNWDYNLTPWVFLPRRENRHNLVRIYFRCKHCGKTRSKIVDAVIWTDLVSPSENIPIPQLKEPFTCPRCEAEISQDATTCPNCNTEIVCHNCGTLIYPNSRHCITCGSPVEKFEVKTLERQEGICPICSEEVPEGSCFCPVCGQELFCDNCGAQLPPGSIFCGTCGNEVKQSDLSK
jgi:hypothetical protein